MHSGAIVVRCGRPIALPCAPRARLAHRRRLRHRHRVLHRHSGFRPGRGHPVDDDGRPSEALGRCPTCSRRVVRPRLRLPRPMGQPVGSTRRPCPIESRAISPCACFRCCDHQRHRRPAGDGPPRGVVRRFARLITRQVSPTAPWSCTSTALRARGCREPGPVSTVAWPAGSRSAGGTRRQHRRIEPRLRMSAARSRRVSRSCVRVVAR